MSQLAVRKYRFFQEENPKDASFFSLSTGSAQVRVLKVTPLPSPKYTNPSDLRRIGILASRILSFSLQGKVKLFIEKNERLVLIRSTDGQPFNNCIHIQGKVRIYAAIEDPILANRVNSIIDELFRLYPDQVTQICIASSLE